MSKSFWTAGRIAGTLLLLSLVIIAAEFMVVLAQGNFEGVPSAWEGVEGIGEKATVFRSIEVFRPPEVVLLFLGFGMLTLRLREAGDATSSFLAFNLFIVFLVLSTIESTFHSEVTAWAGRNGPVQEPCPRSLSRSANG